MTENERRFQQDNIDHAIAQQRMEENRVCDPIARIDPMTPEHINHLGRVLGGADKDLCHKYEKGVKEHGGRLWEKGLLSLIGKEMRAEAIDQVVYTHCLIESLEKIKTICESHARAAGAGSPYHDILEILEGKIKE